VLGAEGGAISAESNLGADFEQFQCKNFMSGQPPRRSRLCHCQSASASGTGSSTLPSPLRVHCFLASLDADMGKTKTNKISTPNAFSFQGREKKLFYYPLMPSNSSPR